MSCSLATTPLPGSVLWAIDHHNHTTLYSVSIYLIVNHCIIVPFIVYIVYTVHVHDQTEYMKNDKSRIMHMMCTLIPQHTYQHSVAAKLHL